jgi:Phosphotransferase enzyme family
MKHNILARHPTDLTINWAQRVVNLHSPGTTVLNISITSVDIGTTTRVRVVVEHDNPEALPQRWFIKLPSLAWQARLITALPRLLHTEVRFYNKLASTGLINVPDFIAAQSKFGIGATLVLFDIIESGATPGTPSDALTITKATAVVKQLAKFHTHFWNKVHSNQSYRWLAEPIRRLEDHLGAVLSVPLMKRGLHLAGELIPSTLHAPAIRYARNRRKVMRFLSGSPQTIIHHDCHPGNLFWNQSQPGFLDWQLVRFGEGISDISYFLSTAIKPEIRRLHEANLLTIYKQELINNGISYSDVDNMRQRYRAHLIYPFEAMIVTLAIGGMMSLEHNYELLRRTIAAIEDHDVFSVIPM